MKLGESLVDTEEYFRLKTFRDNIIENKILVHKVDWQYEQWITNDEGTLILLKSKQSLTDSLIEKSNDLESLKLEFKKLQQSFDDNVDRKVFKNTIYTAALFVLIFIILEIIVRS